MTTDTLTANELAALRKFAAGGTIKWATSERLRELGLLAAVDVADNGLTDTGRAYLQAHAPAPTADRPTTITVHEFIEYNYTARIKADECIVLLGDTSVIDITHRGYGLQMDGKYHDEDGISRNWNCVVHPTHRLHVEWLPAATTQTPLADGETADWQATYDHANSLPTLEERYAAKGDMLKEMFRARQMPPQADPAPVASGQGAEAPDVPDVLDVDVFEHAIASMYADLMMGRKIGEYRVDDVQSAHDEIVGNLRQQNAALTAKLAVAVGADLRQAAYQGDAVYHGHGLGNIALHIFLNELNDALVPIAYGEVVTVTITRKQAATELKHRGESI